MLKKCVYAAAVGGLVFLTGCSGGGGSDSPEGPAPGGGDEVVVQRVEGPLDPVQDQVSAGIFTPLSATLADTPLESVVQCIDSAVTYDTLDIADTVLVSLQAALRSGGGTPLDPDPEALAASLRALVADMARTLQALAGNTVACATGTFSLDELTGANPLAGSPLAALGTQLMPVFEQIIAQVGGSGAAPDDLQLTTVAALIAQLNLALQSALAQIPQEAYDAPIVGAALTTLSSTLNDTSALLGAALAYDAAGTGAALQTLLGNTLVGLLTEVVPVHMLEDQAGQPGVISGPIEDAIAQFTATLGANLGQVLDPVMSQLLAGALEPVLDPIENLILPTLLGALADALAAGSGGDSTGPLAGTPLAPVVNLVTDVLSSLLGGIGDSTCRFAGLPLLSRLCEI
ncbi:MAG: hypothetical protein AB1651_07995 [Pseudomonadota bacterium]